RGRRPADIGSPSPSPQRSHPSRQERQGKMKLYQTPDDTLVTLTPEVVARLLQDQAQAAAWTLRKAQDRLRRHAVRLVREGADPGEVKSLFGDQVADEVDREQRALAAEAAVGEALTEIESPVTMRVERDRFGDELRVTPDVLADWEAELTGQTAPSPAEVAEAVDRVCAAIARRGLAVRVASDPHAGERIVVSY